MQVNLYNSLARLQSSSFLSPSSSPCKSSGNDSPSSEGYSRRQSKVLTSKSMAKLVEPLGWSNRQAQTQGTSESQSVAAGRGESQPRSFFLSEMKFRRILPELVNYQSRTHRFVESCDSSLVSG